MGERGPGPQPRHNAGGHSIPSSPVTGGGHYRHCIEAQTRRGIKQFVHTTRLPTASWTSGPTTKPAPPPTRRPQDLHNPSPTPAVTARTNSSQVWGGSNWCTPRGRHVALNPTVTGALAPVATGSTRLVATALLAPGGDRSCRCEVSAADIASSRGGCCGCGGHDPTAMARAHPAQGGTDELLSYIGRQRSSGEFGPGMRWAG